MRTDRLLKLAESILESSPPTIMLQRGGTVEFFRLPSRYEKEIVGQQVQLPGLRVGLVDDHQQHALRMPPRLSLVSAQFDNVLIALFGRPPDGPFQMRG